MTLNITHNILVIGPSGAGKSSFLRQALETCGSGAVLMAPGDDERNSFVELIGQPGYDIRGFDDETFLPTLGVWEASGLHNALGWLRQVYAAVKEDTTAGKPPRFAVLGCDTANGVGRMAYNSALAKFKRTEPPAAQSPDGTSFYGYIRLQQEAAFRLMRAIRGMGVHFIATAHPREAAPGEVQKLDAGSSKILADMPGGFRDTFPAMFDLTLYAGVLPSKDGKRVHYLQWKPDPKRVSKSRFGALADSDYISNDWRAVVAKVDEALAKRAAK